jgi:hypothetical protein
MIYSTLDQLRQAVHDRLNEYEATHVAASHCAGDDTAWIIALQSAKRAREAMLKAKSEWYQAMNLV